MLPLRQLDSVVQPWLANTSLRANILCGLPLEPTWYQTVLRACALQPDLEAWPQGDLVLIF